MPRCSRRQALGALGASALLGPGFAAAEDPWTRLPQLLKRLEPPVFPSRDFELMRYGARPDGRTDSTAAFRQAIEAAGAAGGGRVVVPEGAFLTGAIHLKSNVNLHLLPKAVIRFSRDPRHYPVVLTRFEGLECMNYSPFIYAYGQRNIAVTGEGTLDGQADCGNWWPWKGRSDCGWKKGAPSQQKARDALLDMAEKDVPVEKRVFGEGSLLRPMFIQPYRSENVLIEGVTIANSPMYEIHPVLCRNVVVRNVKVASHGPNNDGCDPESSSGVLIENCLFDTGDDCIAIKSGRNHDGRRLHAPSEDIVIQGCTMKDGHGGVTLGSECSGGIRNIFAQKCRMDSPHLDRVLRFKDNAMRGGLIENVYVRDIRAGHVAGAAIEVDFQYEEGSRGPFTPVVRHVVVENVECRQAKTALALRGFATAPIVDVRLSHCTFVHADEPNAIENVKGLVLDDVRINGRVARV